MLYFIKSLYLMNKTPRITGPKFVSKGWGHELHIENNKDYCSKLLIFHRGKCQGWRI